MNLNQEIWDAINATPKLPEEAKKSLHVRILRLIEESRKPTGRKLGVTVMTPEASMGGEGNAPPTPPKSL